MERVPIYIIEYIEKRNLKLLSLLHKNDRKKTYVIKVGDIEKKYILKVISDNSPPDIKEKFIAEVNFYKNNKLNFIPQFIENKHNILNIEFIEGHSLRDCLSLSNLKSISIQSLFDKAYSLYDVSSTIKKENYKNAYTNLNRLLFSGPLQAKNIKFTLQDKIFNKLLWRILRFKLHKYINNLDTDKLKFGFSHGDLHYNNVLVSNKMELWFIDFENIKYEGFYDFDLLYLFVMIEIYLIGKEYDSIKDELISKICESEKDLLNILEIYRIGIFANIKFNKEYKLLYSKISLLTKGLLV